MENSILISSIIAITFLLIKFIHIKLIQKSEEPIKPMVMDSLMVFLSSILGLLIIDQFGFVKNILINNGDKGSAQAFVSSPEF